MRKYEGMFLFDPGMASDWENAKAEITRLMNRVGARIIVCVKWDERRLAYEIRGRKRGVYALTFFEADASRIGDLERDARLSEAILRCLVLRADHLTEEEIKEIAARPADHSAAEAERISGHWGAARAPSDSERKADPLATREEIPAEESVDEQNGHEPDVIDFEPPED